MNKEQQEAAKKLAEWLLNPEGGGFAVGPWERDMARIVVGIRPVECVDRLRPHIKVGRVGFYRVWYCDGFMSTTPAGAFSKWRAAQ